MLLFDAALPPISSGLLRWLQTAWIGTEKQTGQSQMNANPDALNVSTISRVQAGLWGDNMPRAARERSNIRLVAASLERVCPQMSAGCTIRGHATWLYWVILLILKWAGGGQTSQELALGAVDGRLLKLRLGRDLGQLTAELRCKKISKDGSPLL